LETVFDGGFTLDYVAFWVLEDLFLLLLHCMLGWSLRRQCWIFRLNTQVSILVTTGRFPAVIVHRLEFSESAVRPEICWCCTSWRLAC
jgi:hypothetical protein